MALFTATTRHPINSTLQPGDVRVVRVPDFSDDPKSIGAALRAARLLPSGVRVREWRREGDKLHVFPTRCVGIHCVTLEPSPAIIIEICPKEPRTSVCLADGSEVSADPDVAAHLADCNRSGDCEPACLYVLREVGVEFRIVARNASGEYENRLATTEEKAETARRIYFESDADWSDETTVETYLVWDAARDAADTND